MQIEFKTNIGKRDANEDAHNIIVNMDGKNKNILPVNFYGIYDGHGGKFVSKFLSDHLPKFFLHEKMEYPFKKKNIERIYMYVQTLLKEKYPKKVLDTGSTALIAVQFKKNGNEYLNVLNSGDCRAVICCNNIAIPITKDHKPDKPEETCRIKNLGGVIKFDGYDWRIGDLSVSRAFGDVSAEPYVTCLPDIFEHMITKKDKFMIMGCDGLWDVMDNQEAVDFVLTNCYDMETGTLITQKKYNIADKLIERALEKKSTDNISVIVIHF